MKISRALRAIPSTDKRRSLNILCGSLCDNTGLLQLRIQLIVYWGLQGTGKTLLFLGQPHTVHTFTHIGPSPRSAPRRVVKNQPIRASYNAQQTSFGRFFPASDASTGTFFFYFPLGSQTESPVSFIISSKRSCKVGNLSGSSTLISIFHPVNRAARRTFCPALPIARDN